MHSTCTFVKIYFSYGETMIMESDNVQAQSYALPRCFYKQKYPATGSCLDWQFRITTKIGAAWSWLYVFDCHRSCIESCTSQGTPHPQRTFPGTWTQLYEVTWAWGSLLNSAVLQLRLVTDWGDATCWQSDYSIYFWKTNSYPSQPKRRKEEVSLIRNLRLIT